jgi:hypothetical protein
MKNESRKGGVITGIDVKMGISQVRPKRRSKDKPYFRG